MCVLVFFRIFFSSSLFNEVKIFIWSYPCNKPRRTIWLWNVEAPTFLLDIRLTDGGKFVSLTRRPPFAPREDSWVLISFRGWVDPRAILSLEELGTLKNPSDIGTNNRDLLVSSIVPQTATAYLHYIILGFFNSFHTEIQCPPLLSFSSLSGRSNDGRFRDTIFDSFTRLSFLLK
jgi:hypothetical protein